MENSTRCTAIERLNEAAKLGSLQLLNTLIEEDTNIVQKCLNPELVVETNTLQRTPLHLASANGDIEMVRVLLEKNTSACLIRDLYGMIPLHYSAIKGHIQVTQDLINARPQTVKTKLGDAQTILHLCVKENQLEAMRMLVQSVINDKDFLNAVDNDGNTILDLSMIHRQIEMVRYLLNIPGTETAGTRSLLNIVVSETRNVQTEGEIIQPTGRKNLSLYDFINNLGKWSDNAQVNLMLVATVTYQSVINPPGGVLQEEQKFNNITIPSNIVFTRGTAVMLYYAIGGRGLFPWFLISNTLSVDPWCSVVVIVLILFRCSMSGMITGFLCTLAMCGAVGSLVLSYVTGVWIVTNGTVSEDDISALFKGVDNNIDFTKWGYIGALPVFMMVAGQVLTIMFHHFLHRIPASYSYTNKSRDSQGL
ncbi:ankyrin repeat-containing protein [Cucumis melo var. makuwa]|uniref:Ankyrin repeat-containing protein n=1 Tax=Cucumis melo var. makuwa TaxID=1194695 RepID=A0A5A7UYC5_CUCMM|nr:ankyrin repeat-containing protein [Cucumis melo var. makuwa]TYK07255.1 ankyrin repeat-containing protein [Cucumis melo var. makuwa]